MTHDYNDDSGDYQGESGIWLFGYGSLLFKPPLHHLDIHQHFVRHDGYATGFVRRFWQSSYDNRGTPEFKGRVVTIVPSDVIAADAHMLQDVYRYELSHLNPDQIARVELNEVLKVHGCVYHIPEKYAQQAREYLDFREKDGYTTQKVEFVITKTGRKVLCDVYVGTEDNESFIGPEIPHETAEIIATASGESGPNTEYLFELVKSLDQMGVEDRYLSHLKHLVLERESKSRDME